MRFYLPRPPEAALYSMLCIMVLMIIGRALFYDLPRPPELPFHGGADHDGFEEHGVSDYEGFGTAPAAVLPAVSTRKPMYHSCLPSELDALEVGAIRSLVRFV